MTRQSISDLSLGTAVRLRRLKKKTGWSWEKMARELTIEKGEDGPAHTTLFRYASGRVRRPNVLVKNWIFEAVFLVERKLEEAKGKK